MAIDTRSFTRIASKHFVLDQQARLSLSGLILIGLIAGILHVHLRYPLNIPGHHGLEWMALLLFGKLLSAHRQAATILATAAATGYLLQSPFMSLAHSVKPALVFLATGWCVDRCISFSRDWNPGVFLYAVIGGLVFLLKPLVMYALFLIVGWKVGMFVKHPDYLPFISHFLFGATGAAGGALMATWLQKEARKPRTQ